MFNVRKAIQKIMLYAPARLDWAFFPSLQVQAMLSSVEGADVLVNLIPVRKQDAFRLPVHQGKSN